jgi:hypothetical protein
MQSQWELKLPMWRVAEYKKAFDFVTNTGQGLMEDGQDITEIVKKMCPCCYELDPIMGNTASTYPVELFESEGEYVILHCFS